MTAEKLLPCWHCGGDAMVRKGLWFYVQCTACPLELGANYDADGNPDGEYLTEGDAIAAWNTRVAVTDYDFAMAVHDGRTWVCVEGALESDELTPIPGFTRNDIYRDSMHEYGEWMEKAVELMRDLWSGFECGVAKVCDACPSGAKLGDAPCDIEERLREFGIGEES